MRRGAGLIEAPESIATVGSTLDEFIGKWSVKQEREFLDSIAAVETVDESLWG